METELKNIEADVKRSRNFIVGAILSAIGVYIYWFFIENKINLSTESAAWGAFGDFVGGLINPLIAYTAFYWLTKSVLIQKQELSDARNALEDSGRAQRKQAKAALKAAKLQSLSVRMSAINQEMSFRQETLKLIVNDVNDNENSKLAVLLGGSTAHGALAIQEAQQKITDLRIEKEKILKEIDKIEHKKSLAVITPEKPSQQSKTAAKLHRVENGAALPTDVSGG